MSRCDNACDSQLDHEHRSAALARLAFERVTPRVSLDDFPMRIAVTFGVAVYSPTSVGELRIAFPGVSRCSGMPDTIIFNIPAHRAGFACLMSALDAERAAVQQIRAAVRGVVLHELDEHLRVDDARVRDPHPGGRVSFTLDDGSRDVAEIA